MKKMGDYKLSSLVFCVSVSLILFLSFPAGATGPPGGSTETSDTWGVRTTTVNTQSGKITINMPDDAALGDTISGTVVAEPAGETVAERQANMDTLEGYVVDIEEIPEKTVVSVPEEVPAKEPEGKKIHTWVIPPTIATEITSLVLKDPEGKEVAKTDLPVASPPAYTPPGEPGPEDYNLPTIGQAGRPVEMTGPFDGKLVNTEVKIGGRVADVLAQSPRKTVAESPRDVIGPTDIELTDGDVTVKERYRSVALKLSADKLRLTRGERTTLRVRVMGLQGLEEEIPFNLVNKSPSVVSMEGGDLQTVTVRPEEVGPEGVYTIEKTLTGVRTGPFSISARISPEYMLVPLLTMEGDKKKDKKVKKCDCNELKVRFDKERKTRRYQETKDGKIRILLEVPYKYKTRCKKGDATNKCEGEIKVEAERKNWKAPEPVSEEVHSGGAKKVTYFTKPPKGADKNIDCSRKCPDRPGMSKEWTPGTLYYEAVFKEGDNVVEQKKKLSITLTPEKCKSGVKKSKKYDVYSCECNKITLVFPGVRKGAGGKYYIPGDKGGISIHRPGVWLNIPYLYSTECTGNGRAECNAKVRVEAKPLSWNVHTVEKDDGEVTRKHKEVQPANVRIKTPDMIACSGKCARKGKTTDSDKKEKRELEIDIQVPNRNIDRHTGEFELKFEHKYCNELKVMDKLGKDGRVIEKLTVKVDIKSGKWKKLVKDD